MVARLAEAGVPATRDEVGNVVARFGRDEPAVIVAAHLDTVFEDLGPIPVRREGTILHGLGIGDNSLGLAGVLHVARRAAAIDWADRRPLVLAATVCEEGFGNLRGATALLDTVDCAEFVALEGGMRDEVVVRGVGSRRFELTVSTPGGHSWKDRGSASAVHELVALLARLLDGAPTDGINVGSIGGGGAINALAADATALLEFRDVSNPRLEEAAALLAREGEGSAATIAITELGARPAGETPSTSPLVRDACAARRAAGLDPPELTEASTDANVALARGVPAVTVGLADSIGPHTRSERVDVAGLAGTLTALAGLVARRTESSA